MNNKTLVDLIGLLLIALIVVIGYKLSPLLLPKADLTLQPEAGCDLQRQSCGAVLPGGGRVELSITPRPIPMVKPLKVEVSLLGARANRVDVDFAGTEMNMGLNRPALQADGNGRFAGEATLPVCITGAMAWQATVLVETEKERIAIPFRFASGHG